MPPVDNEHAKLKNLILISTLPHAYEYGGAAQLEVGSLPVSVSWPSALHCYLCLTHCSPGNVPNPTPGPLMSTALVNTGHPPPLLPILVSTALHNYITILLHVTITLLVGFVG